MKIRFTFMLLILACCMLGLAFVILYDPGKQTYFRTLANEITHSIEPRVQIDSTMNDDLVVIFNRVPKTGSTSFMKVVYGLINANKFSSLYVNISIKRPMTLLGESWLIHNISRWKEVRPVIFHGHFPFVNFVKYGSSTNPVYINIIRDPLQRLVSFYYFMRYGDDFLPHKKRKRSGDKTTFDECVQKKGEDCQPELLWLQIPYFCGNSPRCWHPGSKWALAQAKKHLVDQYLVVGVLEEVDKFIRILDNTLPRMFKGAISAYSKGGGVHVRRTRQKKPLTQETIDYFKRSDIWKLENEFYQFVRGLFLQQYDAMFRKRGNNSLKKSKILYQKVKIIKHSTQ